MRHNECMGFAGLVAFFFSAPAPTFSHDVAPLLYSRCASCHHDGGVAPFPLVTYADAAKRARLIATVTAKRFMPPWLPSAPRFQHEMKLTDAEIALLAALGRRGCARRRSARDAAAARSSPTRGRSGKPDLEAVMPTAFDVPADGPDLYQCFVIPAPAAGRPLGARARHPPGQRQGGAPRHPLPGHVAHRPPPRTRARVFVLRHARLPARARTRRLDSRRASLPHARRHPDLFHGDADLVLQMHYHPTGKPETDRTRLALYFTPQPPKRRLMDVALGSSRIDIPPGDTAYKVTDHFTVPVDVDALGVIPHAHYICKTMKAWAVLPDGTRRTLLSIPDWNFNWQQQYRYAAPIRLPADTRIEMEFIYDNSAANPRNPNHPPARVTVGPATTDEMAGLAPGSHARRPRRCRRIEPGALG